MIIAVVQLLN